jgi:hypothetical protein
MFKVNELIRVSTDAPFHKGRVGRFVFYGNGEAGGVAVLRDKHDKDRYFAVDPQYLLKV